MSALGPEESCSDIRDRRGREWFHPEYRSASRSTM